MQSPRTPIAETDRNRLSHARVSIEPGRPDIIFSRREVQIDINLTQVLNPNPDVYISDLIFVDCVFLQTVDIGNRQSAGVVKFRDCEFKADVSIETMANVSIETGCCFRQGLTVKGIGFIPELGNFSVDGTLQLEGKGEKLILSNINSKVFQQKLVVRSDYLDVQVTNCFFQRIYLHSKADTESRLAIHGSHADRVVVGADYNNCRIILNESELGRISINTPYEVRIAIKVRYCKKCREILLPMSRIDKAGIDYCEIGKLQVWEASGKTDELIVENCTINQLIFWRYINSGLISLRALNIPEKGILSIQSSNLGQAEFINCDFSKATLEFENSRLTDLFLAETDFPKSVVLNKKVSHIQAQLAFGQLNKAFDKQGDTVRALEYQAREIESHYHNIPSFWRRTPPFIHFTKLNLGLNRLSNNFGRDWGRGIVFAVGVGLLCFVALVWTTKEYSFHGHWKLDRRLIASFARFMNPIRFFDLETLFIQNSKDPYVTLTWGSYVMDLVGRIAIAYGYYQTIQAFRRFGRK